LLSRAVNPLKEYLTKYDKYKDVLSINPDEKIKGFDVENEDE